MSDFNIEVDKELKKQIQAVAKAMYLIGWRAKDVVSIVGMHKILTPDERLKSNDMFHERANSIGWSQKAVDWSDSDLLEKWKAIRNAN